MSSLNKAGVLPGDGRFNSARFYRGRKDCPVFAWFRPLRPRAIAHTLFEAMKIIYGVLSLVCLEIFLIMGLIYVLFSVDRDHAKICRNCNAYDNDLGYCWLKLQYRSEDTKRCCECKKIKAYGD